MPARCLIIAGPNGAGKTTFAREFLLKDTNVIHFVNADLIAAGLSALRPEIAAVTAGRVFLAELDRLAAARASFAFETTFSGRSYVARLAGWKLAGFRIEIAYLKIDSPQIALKRIASRVKQAYYRLSYTYAVGDVLTRNRDLLDTLLKVSENRYAVGQAAQQYDNSQAEPQLLEQGP